MSDPTTPEGRAELRAVAEAVGKRARWNWDGIEGKFFVHESAWNVAEIGCGSYDRSSDEERVNVERRIARFIAAADPETVCKLLDALEKAEKVADTKSKVADAFQQALTDEYRPHVERNKAYGMALALQEEQLAELRDRAEKAEAALERQERELAGYRAEEQRVREWNAIVNEGNVRCTWCDLRYAEREEYPCGDERDQNSHHYNADELAEARRKALDGTS